MFLILRWILNAIALLIVAYLVPGIVVANFYTALVAALVLGLINAIVRPLVLILTLPVNILTLGLFTFVINAVMLYFASTLVKGLEISGIVAAFLGAVVLWVISILTNHLIKAAKEG